MNQLNLIEVSKASQCMQNFRWILLSWTVGRQQTQHPQVKVEKTIMYRLPSLTTHLENGLDGEHTLWETVKKSLAQNSN